MIIEDTTTVTQDAGTAPSGAETSEATAGTAAKRGAKTQKTTGAARRAASNEDTAAKPKRAPARRSSAKTKNMPVEAAAAEQAPAASRELPEREGEAPAQAPEKKTARAAAKTGAKAPVAAKTASGSPGRKKSAPARVTRQAAPASEISPEAVEARTEAPLEQTGTAAEAPQAEPAVKSPRSAGKKTAAKSSPGTRSKKAGPDQGGKTPEADAGSAPEASGAAAALAESLPEPVASLPEAADGEAVASAPEKKARAGKSSASKAGAGRSRSARSRSVAKESPLETPAETAGETPAAASGEAGSVITGAPRPVEDAVLPEEPAAALLEEKIPAEDALSAPADFPSSFGDASTEDAFPAMDAVAAQDGEEGGEAQTPVQEGGEKKRRSRSRRGRGRKKTAASQAVSENGEDADPERSEDEEDVEEREEARASAKDKGKAREDEEETAASAGGKGPRRKMFVSVLPEEQVEVVITEEGQVQEYYVEMLHQAKTKGNIYKGVVHNVDANLQAAFVSYGAVKNGFLQIDEVHPEYYVSPHDPGKGRKYPPIQKVLKAGQEVLVQVVKEPSGTKGAFLTTYLSLPGRFLVLTPGREQIGVSRKVENESERGRLRELLEGLNPGPGLGVIVRTVSIGASKTNLQKDLQFLKRTWKDVRARGTAEKAPSLVYQEIDLTSRAVRDYLTDAIGEIWIDDESTAASVTEVAEALFPRKQNLVRVHKDAGSTLFERFNIQRQLDQIHSREVVLPSGGRLVIDPTEALTAIDINSGRSSGKSNFEDMAYRTNMEAARMIPLQLRLRDIGGQVVADFIEMRDKSHWREVEKTLRNGMKVDRARYDVGKIGPFGLLEIVRQRLGSSAISVSTEPCPCCNGTGVRRNMEWQSQHALRDILRLMRNAQAQDEGLVVYQAEPPVALHLLNHKRQRLAEMEQTYGVRLEVQIKPQPAV